MCLAIPGQVIELVDEANQIATVDVVGVRRNINVSLLASDGDEARPLIQEAVLSEWLLKRAQRNHLAVEARLALAGDAGQFKDPAPGQEVSVSQYFFPAGKLEG